MAGTRSSARGGRTAPKATKNVTNTKQPKTVKRDSRRANGEDIEMEEAHLANGNEDPLSDPADPEELLEDDGEEDEEEDLLDGADFISDDNDDDEDDDEEEEEEGQEEDEDDEEGVPLDAIDEDQNGALHDTEEEAASARGPSIPGSITSFPATTLTGVVDEPGQPSLNPQKPIPYTHDAGHLLISDANPLDLSEARGPGAGAAAIESVLAAATRDAAQSLLSHLLTTCPIRRSKDSETHSGLEMVLPAPTTQLPREKRVPAPKAPTKWELFARKKGIGKYAGHKGARSAATDAAGNLVAGSKVFDSETGEWVPRWGYKGRNKAGEEDWLVEVDEKAERAGKDAGDPRALKRAERKDRVRRNARLERANERRTRKGAK